MLSGKIIIACPRNCGFRPLLAFQPWGILFMACLETI